MINCTFLPVFYQHHLHRKERKPAPEFDNYSAVEDIWMNLYGLGKFETYQFVYEKCTSEAHLQEWLIQLKGAAQITASAKAFEDWRQGADNKADNKHSALALLTEAQRQSWQKQGYLKISDLVAPELCDAVAELICDTMEVDLSRPETWYNPHAGWHGLMLQLYQHESIQAIRTHPAVKQVFAELYGTTHLIARTEKVSFNPPETDTWKFAHGKLHWDIDFNTGELFYIQGLIYLNDVPENRGPLQLVPGFQHRFEDFMKTWPDFQRAHEEMQRLVKPVPVPGKKGDIVLWQQTLPHAASANHSTVPRFVQYLSFSKL